MDYPRKKIVEALSGIRQTPAEPPMPHSEVFNEDCMQMKRYEDKYFYLAIPDVPYGIGESRKNHASRNTPIKQKNGQSLKAPTTTYTKKDWDNSPPDKTYFDELFRVSKNQIIFGANYCSHIPDSPFKCSFEKPPRRNEYEKFIKENPHHWIIWDKVNGDNDFSDCELLWCSQKINSYVFYYMWHGMMQGKSIKEGTTQHGNKKLNEKRIHPCHKPIAIYQKLLKEFSQDGQMILDTHLGGGSSRIACHKMGLNFIGFEIDSEYYQKQEKRFNQYLSQLKLF